ncbi:MAG TPA: DNA-directed RNA polymerase subunit alpha [Candidatus Aveggerthella excrementigallinarum]|nr:DNA-directed RNA polymerase subunit alpha [Candidatus Aveggerthella excrementigallinarum]
MTEFMRPTVTTEEVNDTVARYIVEPLERGYGYTLGNCMRRVLLSSLDGAKATAIQIEGVQHEFTTAEGVVEDITDIVLNVKGLVFSALNDSITEATAHVSAEGPCIVTGADLEVPTEFTLINPEHVIATVADGGQLDMTIRIGVGRGYVSAERNKRTEDPIGVIHVDSLFSPVRRCTLNVTDTRVGQRTDYDKLVLEVETDGSIAPTEAVTRAANIINQYMGAFLGLAESDNADEEAEAPSIFAPEGQESNAELDKQIEDLDLSVRSYNCLKRAGIHSVRQLVEYSENDLLNIRNFGAKSIEEVKDKLISMDLNLKL